jgi:hypothetical protein
MHSFVIQKHTKRNNCHFDLMLEEKGKLLTWNINNATSFNSLWKLTKCRRLPDHRIDYLTYEGELSRRRGCVKIWDKGKYLITDKQPSFFTLRLQGVKTKGAFFLIKDLKKQDNWWIATI